MLLWRCPLTKLNGRKGCVYLTKLRQRLCCFCCCYVRRLHVHIRCHIRCFLHIYKESKLLTFLYTMRPKQNLSKLKKLVKTFNMRRVWNRNWVLEPCYIPKEKLLMHLITLAHTSNYEFSCTLANGCNVYVVLDVVIFKRFSMFVNRKRTNFFFNEKPRHFWEF